MDFRHDGNVIHYVAAGMGDPVIFLHGLGGRLDNWVHQLKALSKTHQAIAVDLPGHGHSGGRDVGFLDYWRTIEALLDHLGIRSATLCGLSKGARTGLMLASRRPNRVSAMIVVNAFAYLTPQDMAQRKALYDLLMIGDGGSRWAEALLDQMGVRAHPVIVRGFLRSLRDIDPTHIRARFLEMLAFDQRPELLDVTCPVLVVRGAKDDFVPAYCASELASLIRKASQVTLDLGHLPYLEDPEVFNGILADFLAR
jgi:pimeloyl-ACP methyl ester carboxylesterase